MLQQKRFLPALVGLLALLPTQVGTLSAQADTRPAHPVRAAAASSQAAQGRALYVTNSLSDNVAGFTVGADGSPIPNGAPVPTSPGGGPSGIVMAPDGRTAYVVERGAGAVRPYRVGAGGALSSLSDPVPTRGQTPFGVAMAPDGRTLYTANLRSGTISVFAIGADGTLALRGDPVPASDNPRGLAITPDGLFLYVGHGVPLTDPTNTLDRFAIGADGTLSGRSTVATTGGAGTGMQFTPDGRFLYVSTTTTDQLMGFGVGKDGSLTALPGSPYSVSDHPEGLAMAPDGRHLFLASPSQVRPDTIHALSAFTIGDDGALHPVPGSPFYTGAGPVGIGVTPDGRYVYVSHLDGNELYGFAIGSGGALTKTPGSPVSSGGQTPAWQALAIAPDQGPTATLSTPAGPVQAGQAVDLHANASTDPDGKVARYDWDFGDGTVLHDADPEPYHVYAASGTFTARVTVTDDEGCSATRVFTGQNPSCNGSDAATDTVTVTVTVN